MRTRYLAWALALIICGVLALLSGLQHPAAAQTAPPAGMEIPKAPSKTDVTKSSEIPAPATTPTDTGGGTLILHSGDDAKKVDAQYAYKFTVLSIIIAAVIIVAFCFMYFFQKATGEFSKHYIVIVVVVASIFLLVMGYSEQQVAPAFGLLGTILGYMFGRGINGTDAKESRQEPDTPAPEPQPVPLGPAAGPGQNPVVPNRR